MQKEDNKLTIPTILGDMVWLKMQTKEGRYTFLSELEWQVLPPIKQKQFRLFRSKDKPIAYVTWACVNEETEKRLKSGQLKLAQHEWANGDRLWLIEFVSPFGASKQSLINLKDQVFKNKTVNVLVPDEAGNPMTKSLDELIQLDKDKSVQVKT